MQRFSLPMVAKQSLLSPPNLPMSVEAISTDDANPDDPLAKGIEDSHTLELHYDIFLGFTQKFKETYGDDGIKEYEIFKRSNQSIPIIISALLLVTIDFAIRGSLQHFYQLNNYFIAAFAICGFDVMVLSIVMIIRFCMFSKWSIMSGKLFMLKKRIIRFSTSRIGRALENILIVTAPIGMGFYGLGRVHNPCSIIDPPSMWNMQECILKMQQMEFLMIGVYSR